ncbi:transcription repressor NadR [uncultured Merdimonas sp.]|uniref:transcription repressor NadR n=1 Tax=uncultured Merdimonas sp. TaxID=2023269 RepID=UPI0032094764
MTGAERREEIIRRIREADQPVPARDLAGLYHVSRQVIVQDIALIRALGYEIISTNRGYLLHMPSEVSRVFKVRHTDEQLEEELCAIVDLGGTVENVMVSHRVYGRLEAELGISSRRKAAEFLEDIRSGKSSPLKNITSGYHYHKVTADSEKTLDLIREDLKKRGFLVETEETA